MAVYSDYFDNPNVVSEPTPEEEAEVTRRLMNKYPQMFTDKWRRKLLGLKKPKKKKVTLQTRKALDKLRDAGLTEKEIESLL